MCRRSSVIAAGGVPGKAVCCGGCSGEHTYGVRFLQVDLSPTIWVKWYRLWKAYT